MASPPPVPRLARALLRLALPPSDRRFALADLEEEFEERRTAEGLAAARRWYRGQALRSVPPALTARIRGLGRLSLGDAGAAELRFALRTLARAPTTVAVTALSLGLGIGAVTTVFNVADALLYPPATGLTDPQGLVAIYTSEDDGERYGSSSLPDFESVRGLAALQDAAAATIRLVALEGPDGPEKLLAEEVSGPFFRVTGIRTVLGRAFGPGEAVAGDVVVLGHDLWVERFAADPAVIGRPVRLDGRPVTVVGVAPEGVMSRRVPVQPDLWIPRDAPGGGAVAEAARNRSARDQVILGRYAAGADLDALQAQLDVLARRLADEHPEAWTDDAGRGRTLAAVPERRSRVNPGARGVLGGVAVFFLVATGLVLLIACTNVTSLFLVRAERRRKEIAVRLALGASRWRILRLLLMEGLLVGAVAGGVGVGFAHLLAEALASFTLPVDVPLPLDFQPSGRAYLFAFSAALATSLIFSLVPGLRVSRPDLVRDLRATRGARSARSSRFSLGSALVAVQFAAALVLLGGAGLFIRSVQEADTWELGVDPTGVALLSKRAPDEVEADQIPAFLRDLEERAAAVPGARTVALARGVELTLLQLGASVTLAPSGGTRADDRVPGFRNSVTTGYFDAVGIALLRGRGIEDGDVEGATEVAVVNETLARDLWPGEDPLGRSLRVVARGPGRGEARTVSVVGVARDGLYLDVDDPPLPYLWTSLYQDPARTVAVVARGASADAMVAALRRALPPAPGEVPVLLPTTYESQLSFQFIHLRLASRVLGWGGAFGLFLALIGIYALVAFTVSERIREIAIRRVVGAEPGRVVREVVVRGLALAGVGLAVGLVALLAGAHLVRGVLLGVAPTDPLALGGSLLLLAATATAAAFIPARKAARVDPMESLRQE